MKYILIFILVYWIARRVFRIFAVVGNDQGSNTSSNTNYSPPRESRNTSEPEKGEYIDFEEIE